jgi:hypothetical protein
MDASAFEMDASSDFEPEPKPILKAVSITCDQQSSEAHMLITCIES